MKKFLFILTLLAGITFGAQAKDSYVRDASVLPQGAQTFLAKNFKSKISFIKIDKTLGHIDDYEVIMTDGTEIDFDSKGNWENIETPGNRSVPSSLLPKAITSYVAKNHKGLKIVGVEKGRNKFDIELSNGLDLVFDADGNFLKFD